MLAGLHPPVQATEDGLVLAHDAQAGDFEHGDWSGGTSHDVRLWSRPRPLPSRNHVCARRGSPLPLRHAPAPRPAPFPRALDLTPKLGRL
jgi:hypothetical protein